MEHIFLEVEILEDYLYLQITLVFKYDSIFRSLGNILVLSIFTSSKLEALVEPKQLHFSVLERLRTSELESFNFAFVLSITQKVKI